jgi:spermidine synthase
MMAHLPLALLSHKPQSVLDICFGMGTTFRSLMSWGVSATAVDLVPSVFKAFPYYHSDAQSVLADPRGRLVADDGRRFLQRSMESFDLITIDPPPPVEAAGSSLLYSTGFYAQAKKHLKKDGLLQQWIPTAEFKIVQAVARSIVLCFPYVRVFAYPYGAGYHFIASLSPIPGISPREMAQRMPLPARKDMVEWTPQESPEDLFRFFLRHEVDPKALLNGDLRVVITDDRPYNEYFLLRRFAARGGAPSNP